MELSNNNDSTTSTSFCENKDNLLASDSFMLIINSITLYERKKCLKIADKVQIINYPLNKVYIRESYFDMFQNICKLFHKYTTPSKIVVRGKPGVGKSSFLFFFLYLLKCNLCRNWSEDEKKYIKKERLEKELSCLNSHPAIQEINERIDVLEKSIKDIDNKQITFDQINEMKKEINDYYNKMPNVFNTLVDSFMGNSMYTLDKFNKKYKLHIISPSETIIDSQQGIMRYCKARYKINVEKIKKLVELLVLSEFCYLKKMKDDINNVTLLDKVICGYVISRIILNRLNNINNINTYKNKKDDMIKEIENLIKLRIERETVLNNRIREISDEIRNIKCDDKKNNNNAIEIEFEKDIFEKKKIYVIKGKKVSALGKVGKYIFEKDEHNNYVLRKTDIIVEKITNSIIIVDTCNCEINSSNYILSISSDYRYYLDNYFSTVLYFDSFNDNEIVEWFDNCIDIKRGREFGVVCRRYGNTPTHIFAHYLYQENYKKDYWLYYQELIKSVIGTIGYNNVIVNYMICKTLNEDPLSNIILKYDFKIEWDSYLCNYIKKPKEHLKFISDSIEKYIKFYPPNDYNEFRSIIDNFLLTDDEYMRRNAIKYIAAYELSTELISISEKDDDLSINKDVDTIIYHPIAGIHTVYYILNETNCFNLIIEGVFIKILYENETFDTNDSSAKEEMLRSYKEYGDKDKGKYIHRIIKEEEILEKMNVDVKQDYSTKTIITKERCNNNSNNSYITPITREYNVFYKNSAFYYMRDCYYKILEYICPENFNFKHQRNYLIIGSKRIGKSTLASIIREYIHKKYENIRIIKLYNTIDGIIIDNEYNDQNSTNPYIVIADGVTVGEDDYCDAKIIILLANASKETSKTFQNKRCWLIMYIPPFSEEEMEEVKKLANPIYIKDIECETFIKFADLSKKESNEINNDEKILYDRKKKIYDDYFVKYGGIIGSYNNIEFIIDLKFYGKSLEKRKKFSQDIINAVNKSPFSRGEYDNLLIYDTDKNDVTKSSHLIFLSDYIKDLVMSFSS